MTKQTTGGVMTGLEPDSKGPLNLYKDEDNVVLPVIRIRRITGEKREKWRCYQGDREVLTVEAAKLTVREKEFLRTPEGFTFLLGQCKAGIATVSRFRQALKARLGKPSRC